MDREGGETGDGSAADRDDAGARGRAAEAAAAARIPMAFAAVRAADLFFWRRWLGVARRGNVGAPRRSWRRRRRRQLAAVFLEREDAGAGGSRHPARRDG